VCHVAVVTPALDPTVPDLEHPANRHGERLLGVAVAIDRER